MNDIELADAFLVHELVHLLDRKHSNRFKSLMDEFMLCIGTL